jgi:hypothetical protein
VLAGIRGRLARDLCGMREKPAVERQQEDADLQVF